MSFSLHAKKLIFTSAAFFLLASCAPDKIGFLAGLTTEPSHAPDDALLRSPEIDYATKGVDTTTFQGGTPNMASMAVLSQSPNTCIAYSVTGAMSALLNNPISPTNALSLYHIDPDKGGSPQDLKNFADTLAASNLVNNKITVSPLHSDKSRDAVKSALNSGNLVVFAFNYNDPKLEGDPLPIKQSGSDSLSIRNEGLYVCKYGNNNDICGIGGINTGHAVIITGYDDNQQLFRIRNSFGSGVGDNGDFYMSYKFFSIRGIVWIELHATGTTGSAAKKKNQVGIGSR